MLFRPSYCANCGEKIEREDWHLWTSRRFCALCETEFKAHDLLPRVVVGLGILTAVFGFGSYLKSGADGPEPAVARQLKSSTEKAPVAQTITANSAAVVVQQTNTNLTALPAGNFTESGQSPKTVAELQPRKPLSGDREYVAEPLYYCGAQTKKGTPCTRRVKGNVRCYQHTGMPAMLPPDKLKVG